MPGRGSWRPHASLSHRIVCCSHRSAARAAAKTAASTAGAATAEWSSCVSRRVNMELAVEEAVEGARAGHPEDWEPELALVFLSSAYVAEYRSLVELLRSKVPSLRIITGSTGEACRLLAAIGCNRQQQPKLAGSPQRVIAGSSTLSMHAFPATSHTDALNSVFFATGYGVIGSTTEGPEEIEHAPALSLTLGSLPGTSLSLSHIQQLPDGGE